MSRNCAAVLCLTVKSYFDESVWDAQRLRLELRNLSVLQIAAGVLFALVAIISVAGSNFLYAVLSLDFAGAVFLVATGAIGVCSARVPRNSTIVTYALFSLLFVVFAMVDGYSEMVYMWNGCYTFDQTSYQGCSPQLNPWIADCLIASNCTSDLLQNSTCQAFPVDFCSGGISIVIVGYFLKLCGLTLLNLTGIGQAALWSQRVMWEHFELPRNRPQPPAQQNQPPPSVDVSLEVDQSTETENV